MNVHIKVFPITGLSEQRQEMELTLEEGNMGELKSLLFDRLGRKPDNSQAYMFLLNGCGMEDWEKAAFRDGDRLWMLPQISGG